MIHSVPGFRVLPIEVLASNSVAPEWQKVVEAKKVKKESAAAESFAP